MSSDPFQAARERVTAQEAARHYGLTIDRHGKALCPFHPDKHPSMTFKGSRYRCWVCDASGDAVDLVRGLYGGTYMDALRRINQDFGLGLPLGGGKPTPQQRAEAQERQRTRALHQQFEQWRADTINQLNACIRAANTADWDNLTPQEVEAIRQREQMEYWADTLSPGTPQEQLQLFLDRKKVLLLTSLILRTLKTR